MRWGAGERGLFHNSCLNEWNETYKPTHWTPVGNACQRKIAKCIGCDKDFNVEDDVVWSQCQRHAFHRSCHTQFEAVYIRLPWRPIMCPCLPGRRYL